MSSATHQCADLLTPVHRSVCRAHLSVHSDGAGHDGGLRRLPSADRLHHRDAGQLGGGRNLQTGGRRLRGAALSDGAGAGEEREGEPSPAAEAARHGREDAELREEDEETESARGASHGAF